MGIFDFFKTKQSSAVNSINKNTNKKSINNQTDYADSSSIAPDEKCFYKPDEYYTYYSYPGTEMAKRVITFVERKKISYPSKNGLYVAEIMLLEYCSYGKYPKPQTGYPGLWWFQYGIRDVGHALESLEKRGFISWRTKKDTLATLKVSELKQILTDCDLSVGGKKTDLIERIIKEIPEEKIHISSYIPKYVLTELGKDELDKNGYVPYMHKHSHKTTEDDSFGSTFNVWSINKLFPNGDATNWKEVVGEIELKRFGVDMVNAEPTTKMKDSKNNADRDNMRAYLASQRNYIENEIKSNGDGFAEESKGLDYRKIGKDKEALVQFYIAIGKRFDAPALYRESISLLQTYKMYDEALYVIDKWLAILSKENTYRSDLLKKRDKGNL